MKNLLFILMLAFPFAGYAQNMTQEEFLRNFYTRYASNQDVQYLENHLTKGCIRYIRKASALTNGDEIVRAQDQIDTRMLQVSSVGKGWYLVSYNGNQGQEFEYSNAIPVKVIRVHDKWLIDSIIPADDPDINERKIEKVPPQVKAEFQGGDRKYDEYIHKNRRPVRWAEEHGITTVPVVKFIITKNGEVRNVEVMNEVAPSIASEACRLIWSMPRWKPARRDGKCVDSIVYRAVPVL
ncbi:MAG: energy transducer TonB [Prevotella sp.]|jgi:hypothetical protein|nr:energy transducer TonB [Prevotella sp.]MCI1817427.1 energy transducer TonB [Prevotella sp.]